MHLDGWGEDGIKENIYRLKKLETSGHRFAQARKLQRRRCPDARRNVELVAQGPSGIDQIAAKKHMRGVKQ